MIEKEDIRIKLVEIEKLLNQNHYNQSINRSLDLLANILLDLYKEFLLKAMPSKKEKLLEIEKKINQSKSLAQFTSGQIIQLVKDSKVLDHYKEKDEHGILRGNLFLISNLRNKCEHHGYKATESEASLMKSYIQVILESLDFNIDELLQEIDDEQSKAKTILKLKTNNLPRPEYIEFIGRTEKIDVVLAQLGPKGRSYIISIDGIGGVGKSALALEIAYLCLNKKLFDSIIWVSAKTERLGVVGVKTLTPNIKSLDDLLNIILEEFGNKDAIENFKVERKKELVYEYLSNITVLLIIDNFETITDKNIDDFLKDMPIPSKILMTSRKRMGEVERVIPLEEFSLIETEQFLKSEFTAKKISYPDFKKYSDDIHRITGGIPLALKMTIAWIINEGLSIENIKAKLQSQDSDILSFCFDENFEKHMDFHTRRVFCVFPIFNSEPTMELLKASTKLNEDQLNKSIATLLNLSLIFEIETEDDNHMDNQYGMLPLTMMYAHQKLTEQRGLDQEARKALSEYLELNQQTQEATEQLDLALHEVGGQSPKGRMAAQLANLGLANFQRGNYEEAVNLCERALRTDPKLSYSYQIYASIERLQGNYTKSDELFKKAAELNPRNHVIWSSWGMLKADCGDLVEARKMLKKAQKMNPNNPFIKQQLAVVQSKLGHFNESVELAKKNIIIPPSSKKERMINTVTMTSLAETYWKWGMRIQNKSINKALGTYFIGLNYIIENFQNCYQNNYKLIYGMKKLRRAIGIIYRKLRNYEKAEEFFNNSLYKRSKLFRKEIRFNSNVEFDRVLNFNKWEKYKEMKDLAIESFEKYSDSRFLEFTGDYKFVL
ncbi:MAG: tetratricopeptide repeat protein [Candidatus Heimdallarchaeota archaeon]|nr:tetratricopeptide repeat protein [Candidatus Heimdallarchaeota archaeon]